MTEIPPQATGPASARKPASATNPASDTDPASAAQATGVDVAAHAQRIDEQGWTVVPNAIEPDLIAAIAEDLDRLEHDLNVGPCRNAFEGHNTVRIYNLLVHGPTFEKIPVHPAILPIVERVLDRGCLISSLSSIAIDPGEVAQPIHADDQLINLDKPHKPLVCNTMWAITDFTEANGATRLVPGTHVAECDPNPFEHHDTIAAEMTAGSVLVWNGSLWHGGGANTTDTRRVGIAMNYCAGFIRQQENQQLGIPTDVVAGFEPRLQQLVGYDVYHGLIGHIDKKKPTFLLGGEGDHRMVWDV